MQAYDVVCTRVSPLYSHAGALGHQCVSATVLNASHSAMKRIGIDIPIIIIIYNSKLRLGADFLAPLRIILSFTVWLGSFGRCTLVVRIAKIECVRSRFFISIRSDFRRGVSSRFSFGSFRGTRATRGFGLFAIIRCSRARSTTICRIC